MLEILLVSDDPWRASNAPAVSFHSNASSPRRSALVARALTRSLVSDNWPPVTASVDSVVRAPGARFVILPFSRIIIGLPSLSSNCFPSSSSWGMIRSASKAFFSGCHNRELSIIAPIARSFLTISLSSAAIAPRRVLGCSAGIVLPLPSTVAPRLFNAISGMTRAPASLITAPSPIAARTDSATPVCPGFVPGTGRAAILASRSPTRVCVFPISENAAKSCEPLIASVLSALIRPDAKFVPCLCCAKLPTDNSACGAPPAKL
ncbi:hypothetical protein Brsp05_04410 [Brucella sp. NBRC 12953]